MLVSLCRLFSNAGISERMCQGPQHYLFWVCFYTVADRMWTTNFWLFDSKVASKRNFQTHTCKQIMYPSTRRIMWEETVREPSLSVTNKLTYSLTKKHTNTQLYIYQYRLLIAYMQQHIKISNSRSVTVQFTGRNTLCHKSQANLYNNIAQIRSKL